MNNTRKTPELCRTCGDFLQGKSKIIGENILYCMAGHEAFDISKGLYVGEVLDVWNENFNKGQNDD